MFRRSVLRSPFRKQSTTPDPAAVRPSRRVANVQGEKGVHSFLTSDNNDGVVYINLDSRPDKNEQMKGVLSSLGIPEDKLLRLSAVDGSAVIGDYDVMCDYFASRPGALGCALSHIEAIELAIKNNWDRVLIVEDDFLPTGGPNAFWDRLNAGLDELSGDFDVLLLGYVRDRGLGDLTPISRNSSIARVSFAQTTSAYMVARRYYETLLDHFSECVRCATDQTSTRVLMLHSRPNIFAIDQWWKSLQERDSWYAAVPRLSRQRPGYSDIEGMHHDYGRLEMG